MLLDQKCTPSRCISSAMCQPISRQEPEWSGASAGGTMHHHQLIRIDDVIHLSTRELQELDAKLRNPRRRPQPARA